MSRQLASLLLQAGVLTQQELEEAQAQATESRRTLLDVIVTEKAIPEETLAECFAKYMNVPYVRLAVALVEPEVVRTISEELARKYLCLPLKIEDQTERSGAGEGRKRRPSLVLAMANPTDFAVIQDVEFASGCTVKPVVATRTEVLDAIEKYYSPENWLDDFLTNVRETDALEVMTPEPEEEEVELGMAARSQAELPPVVKMVNLIIQDGIRMGASDIHIEPTVNELQVRTRVDGLLRDFMQVPKWLQGPVVSRLKILSKLDIAERRLPQDGRIKVQLEGNPVDLRVSTLPTHFGEKVVLRVLASGRMVSSTTALGLEEADLEVLKSAVAQPQGMILVTGPTSSGKTTMLYSLINEKKSTAINIITVEDPIEIQLGGINQVQVNTKAGLTFAACLRSILRQDPDVILVGEIRDLETAEIAFHAAMTGHLVLSTLHTNSTVATVVRLHDLGIDPFLIGSSVNVVMAQRLVRRICKRCKEEYQPSDKILERFQIEDTSDLVFYHGRGCEACGNTGYAGRIGIFEVMRITPILRELVNRKASETDLRKASVAAGTTLLLQDAMRKVKMGITTIEEVLRVIQLQEDEIIRCPNCSSLINLDFAICPYCLFALKVLCEACSQELKPEWRICPYCSHRVTKMKIVGERERRLPHMLPAAGGGIPTPTPPAAVPGAAPAVGGTLPTKQARILVVDDDEAIRKLVTKSLAQLPVPVEVYTATNGFEGVAAVESFRPDLVVLDVVMPGMTGFEVCQKLRSNLQTAFIPIMMLTGNTDEESRTQGFLVGTDDYMSKPFSVPELHARVLRLLRRTYGLAPVGA
ncbi:MAG: ATPase, T2SS/T4P/T4SS family [Terriglobia bacterium]